MKELRDPLRVGTSEDRTTSLVDHSSHNHMTARSKTGGCRCSFKKILFCIKFRSSVAHLKFIVAFNIFQVLSWIVFTILYKTVEGRLIKGPFYFVFQTFNPFLKEVPDCNLNSTNLKVCNDKIQDTLKENEKIMKNLMILCVPQLLMLAYLGILSFQTWAKDFQLKMVENFYRINFTYFVYTAFIKVVMALLIGLPNFQDETWVQDLTI